MLEIEESERQSRSLKRRFGNARLLKFKSIADFDYAWPKKIDRELLEELLTLDFLEQAANVILVGPNGRRQNHDREEPAASGDPARATARASSSPPTCCMIWPLRTAPLQLARRLRRYTSVPLLCIDEVGYLSYDARYADLLFEVITRRYQQRATVLTTNKSFGEWNQVFPNAACVVTLVDRLVHRSEILAIDGDSYRLKEAQEQAAAKAALRAARKPKRAR